MEMASASVKMIWSFFILSGGPSTVREAKLIIRRNIGEIRSLIQTCKFVPFPPRPNGRGSDTQSDVNDSRYTALQILFPKTTGGNWVRSTVAVVVRKL